MFWQNKKKYSNEFFEKMNPKQYPVYLKKIYKEKMGHNLNLNNPKLFTEKIQWLKLYDNLPIKTMLADKLLVRDYVREKISDIKFPEVYTVADRFEDLDFSVCSDNFVIKTNHAWHQHVFVSDKEKIFNNKDNSTYIIIRNAFDYYLKINHAFSSGFELQYKDIKRKVYVEENICDSFSHYDFNYKVHCFNGEPKFIDYYKVTVEKGQEHSYIIVYDTEWNEMDFYHSEQPYKGDRIDAPITLPKMLKYAEILSKDFKYVRVDFMLKEEDIYFSEMTFTPSSGFMFFNPPEYDKILGNMLKL